MARPLPHPGNSPNLNALHDWAVKLTQGLRERFAPSDTIPEVGVEAGTQFPTGAAVIWPSAFAVPDGWLETAYPSSVTYLRALYPDLFDLYGTTYNTGGETGLQFRLLPLAAGAGYIWIIKT